MATEYVTRNFIYTFDEYPTEEVRRSYEFPAPLRNKYKQIFGEMDHDGKFVDPTEFHKEGNKLRDFPDDHAHGHHWFNQEYELWNGELDETLIYLCKF